MLFAHGKKRVIHSVALLRLFYVQQRRLVPSIRHSGNRLLLADCLVMVAVRQLDWVALVWAIELVIVAFKTSAGRR